MKKLIVSLTLVFGFPYASQISAKSYFSENSSQTPPEKPKPAHKKGSLSYKNPPTRHQLRGEASVYAVDGRDKFNGRLMASGERMDANLRYVAHRTLPLGTWIEITNLKNGRVFTAKVSDRGPYAHNRVLDVNPRVQRELGMGDLTQVSIKPVYIPKKPETYHHRNR